MRAQIDTRPEVKIFPFARIDGTWADQSAPAFEAFAHWTRTYAPTFVPLKVSIEWASTGAVLRVEGVHFLFKGLADDD